EDAVRTRADGDVTDVGALGLHIVPVGGEKWIRMLRGWQAGVRRIAVIGAASGGAGVAAKLDPAVRRDGEGAVARPFDHYIEWQGDVRDGVVAAERQHSEIGRASCRERREMLVSVVYFKIISE